MGNSCAPSTERDLAGLVALASWPMGRAGSARAWVPDPCCPGLSHGKEEVQPGAQQITETHQ